MFKQTDLQETPFFKEIIDSKYIEFNMQLFLKYLNSGIDIDKDKLARTLLELAIKNIEKPIFSTFYTSLAIGLQNWYIPELEDEEVDEYKGLENIIFWSVKFCPKFYKKHDELQIDYITDQLAIGEFLYYSTQLLSSELTNTQKIAVCYGTYYLINWCWENYPEQTQKRMTEYSDFLFIRKTLSPVAKIELDYGKLVIVVKNKFGKYEFFENTDAISALGAYECGRFITSKEYICMYGGLPNQDGFDLLFPLFENKIFPDEYDDFRIINLDECGSYLSGVALQMNNTWFGYTIFRLDDSELEIDELHELRGQKIEFIEAYFYNWMNDEEDNVEEKDENN